ACFEPVLDYVVVKIPRFSFEKFLESDQVLGSSMKSVGEVMAIGRNFKEALQKAVRSLEIGRDGLGADGKGQVKRVEKLAVGGSRLTVKDKKEKLRLIREIRMKLRKPNCDRIFNIKYAIQMGMKLKDISRLSRIDLWFIYQIKELVVFENKIKNNRKNIKVIHEAKRMGYSDFQIAWLTGRKEEDVRRSRKGRSEPVYKSVDTCSAEFESYTPYFYSTYESESDLPGVSIARLSSSKRRSILILGGGPNRIGQGIEFDYCVSQAAFALREEGYFSIIVNSNPETVSTDYDTSDRLYFEPLCREEVLNIIGEEKPFGAIVQLGGRTPLSLLPYIKDKVKILGTLPEYIDFAENRVKFSSFLRKTGIPHPEWGSARNEAEAIGIARRIGFPVMIRPSYVLGGRAMEVALDEKEVREYLRRAAAVNPEHPVLVDKFLQNAVEVDVDCLSDGESVFIPPLMEHVEEAGIHSGD
ncbi:MAG TPA: carbamoyl phosphate synthase large subunit, partial [bacterium]|nr:carbamoyl phosphate synthase large subunit [bacterium]